MDEGDAAAPRVVRAGATGFLPYDLEGPVQPEMGWLPVTFDRRTQCGSYLMQMTAGATTLPHVHPGYEEFMIISGDLVDSNGSVYRAGDFVSYAPGTRHSSTTREGCVILVVEWRAPAAATPL
jgi:anti-sigma factor ChrR (cupin superfamily)